MAGDFGRWMVNKRTNECMLRGAKTATAAGTERQKKASKVTEDRRSEIRETHTGDKCTGDGDNDRTTSKTSKSEGESERGGYKEREREKELFGK